MNKKKLTKIEKQDKRIKKMEKALLIAKELKLEKQIKFYSEKLELSKKSKKVLEMGFGRASDFRPDEWDSYNIETFSKTIPLAVLKKIKCVSALKIFDGFEVWDDIEDGANPALIGTVNVNNRRAYFIITAW